MRMTVLTAAIFGVVMLVGPAAQAAVVDNFDSYASGSNLASNGYTQFGGGGSIVYPDAGSGLVPPAFPPLEGTQSVYIFNRQLDARGWGTASSEVGDGSTLSWLVKQEVSAGTGQTWFFLSQNAGIGGGSTPAGIILDHATSNVRLFGSAETATAFTYAAATVYLFEMELDFTTDAFTGYVTDVTNGGPRTLLGTQAFSTDLDAATVASDGGVVLGNFNSGSAAFWDDIQITAIPEPASMALLGLGGLMILARRKHC